MTGLDYYDILGADVDANVRDIEKAYLNVSRLIHPDTNRAPDATNTMQKLVTIRDTLCRAEARQHYDPRVWEV